MSVRFLTETKVAVFMTWPQPFHLPILKELHSRPAFSVDYYCLLNKDVGRGWGTVGYGIPVTVATPVFSKGLCYFGLPPFRSSFRSLLQKI